MKHKVRAVPDELLTHFARGEAPVRLAALRTLIKGRVLTPALKDPRFSEGLAELERIADERPADATRHLEAVLALARILDAARAASQAVEPTLRRVLRTPLPPLQDVPDATDRRVLGLALRLADRIWGGRYLADACVSEPSSDKVRLACLISLLTLHPSLSEALALLLDAFRAAASSAAVNSGASARRLRRILAAVRASILRTEVDLGSEPGPLVCALIEAAMPTSVASLDRKLMAQLVEESARLVHELIKTRFALAMEATTYEGLSTLRRALGDFEWERLAEKSAAIRAVGRDAYEGLRLLVKTGSTDDRLMRAVEVALGSRDETRRRTRTLAETESGLTEEARLWLLGESPKRSSVSASESRRLDLDETLADLTLENESLKTVAQQLREEISGELDVVAPRLAEQVRSVADKVAAVAALVDLASRQRGMQARGLPGDVVDFVPGEHQIIGGSGAGVRRVRIVKPAVVSGQGATVRVVKKAIVEAL